MIHKSRLARALLNEGDTVWLKIVSIDVRFRYNHFRS